MTDFRYREMSLGKPHQRRDLLEVSWVSLVPASRGVPGIQGAQERPGAAEPSFPSGCMPMSKGGQAAPCFSFRGCRQPSPCSTDLSAHPSPSCVRHLVLPLSLVSFQ